MESVEVGAATARTPYRPPPGRSAEQIRRDIVHRRHELSSSLRALRDRVGELTDWKRQVREHRTELVLAAAVAGFLVGGAIALRRRGR
jgi:uncharacterized protein DUF3618